MHLCFELLDNLPGQNRVCRFFTQVAIPPTNKSNIDCASANDESKDNTDADKGKMEEEE